MIDMRGPWEITLGRGVACEHCRECAKRNRRNMKPEHKTQVRKWTRTRRKREAALVAQEQLSD